MDLTQNLTGRWVLAAPFRAHVLHLMNTAQVPWPVVAYQAGVPQNTVRTLLFGRDGRIRTKIGIEYATRLLSLNTEDLEWMRKAQTNAQATGPRLRLLRKYHVSWEDLATFMCLDVSTCICLANDQLASCSVMVDILAQAACEAMGFTVWSPYEPDDQFEEVADPAPGDSEQAPAGQAVGAVS